MCFLKSKHSPISVQLHWDDWNNLCPTFQKKWNKKHWQITMSSSYIKLGYKVCRSSLIWWISFGFLSWSSSRCWKEYAWMVGKPLLSNPILTFFCIQIQNLTLSGSSDGLKVFYLPSGLGRQNCSEQSASIVLSQVETGVPEKLGLLWQR